MTEHLCIDEKKQLSVCIEGDRSGFVSKSAIDKFKTFIKTNIVDSDDYNLQDLSDKYMKENYIIKLISRTENEIKFNIESKPVVVSNKSISDAKQKLRDKIKNQQASRGKKTGNTETKYTLGQDKNSEIMDDVIYKLQEKFKNCRVINITDDINADNYRDYQIVNYNTNIIMTLEKTERNSSVFSGRVDNKLNNIMVMFQGAYRTFQYINFDYIIDSLSSMIKI
jgi:hypothetical protein